MNNNQDFDLDDDIFNDDPGAPQKVSLKTLWEENPLFKIIVIVGVIIILYVGYSLFFAKGEEEIGVSRLGDAVNVTAIPGEGEADPAYRDAVIDTNQQRAENARETGGSALPTQIGAEDRDIDMAGTLGAEGADPLETWRRQSEAITITQDGENQALPSADQELAPILEPYNAPTLQPPATQMQPPAPQPVAQIDPDLTNRFAEQMRVIMGTKQPQAANLISTGYPSMYQKYLEERAAEETQDTDIAAANAAYGGTAGAENAAAGNLSGQSQDDVILAAGTVSYAQIVNAVNSDINGPVLAQILSGPLAGGRAIGQFQRDDEYLVLEFNRVVKDDIVYSAEAYALDADTTLAGVRTDVNRHWIRRIILPAAAEFIAGMGAAIAETATNTTVVDGAAVVDQDELTTEEEIGKGVERGADRLSQVLEEDERAEVTVTIDKGTPVGLLFVESVTSGDAE